MAPPASLGPARWTSRRLALPAYSRARDTKVPLTVFLVNGVKLQGVITGFDNFSLLLARGADAQLVYKHAISTIAPLQPLQLYEPEEKPGQADRTSRRPQVAIRRR